MIPAAKPQRYAEHAELLARLAEHLRASRAGLYEAMISKGQISREDAKLDAACRASIAADWRAIADGAPRDPDVPSVSTRWAVRALQQALAGAEARLKRDGIAHPDFDDNLDTRDAIACLVALQPMVHCQLWWGEDQRARLADRPERKAA